MGGTLSPLGGVEAHVVIYEYLFSITNNLMESLITDPVSAISQFYQVNKSVGDGKTRTYNMIICFLVFDAQFWQEISSYRPPNWTVFTCIDGMSNVILSFLLPTPSEIILLISILKWLSCELLPWNRKWKFQISRTSTGRQGVMSPALTMTTTDLTKGS